MVDITRVAQTFLNELSVEAFETLSILAEQLESKEDPEPTEVRLVANIYEFIDKLKMLEMNLQSYVKNSNKQILGNKLESLYEEYRRSIF